MKTSSSEKGQVLVLIAFLMVGLIGITAVAVDGGRTYAERRSVQNGADNAALAGALAKCYNESATTAALAAAASNGFDNNGTTNTVIAYNPPTSGPYAGISDYVEVVITSSIDTTFAQVVYSGDLGANARALARCRRQFDYAVIALDTSNEVRGLQVIGNGDLIVSGAGVISNSSHPTQSVYESGSGILYADPIHASGGVSGDGFSTTPVAGVPPVEDPLAYVPPPPNPGGTCIDANYSGAGVRTLSPGLYCRIRGDSNVSFVLLPGIYYIDGPGGFEVTANSTITGAGVMIYLSPTAGSVNMLGNAYINLTAPTSGDYEGMLFYADRSYTQSISMIGNASWDAVGTIYAASADIDLSGNGVNSSLSSMIVANTVTLGGDSDVIVDYDPGNNFQPPLSVQLVE